MKPAEQVALAVMGRRAEIVGRIPLRPTIFAESVAISGEALLVGLIVLVVIAVAATAALAALVYLGAHLATRQTNRRPPLARWLWVLCSAISVAVILALPGIWYVGPIAAVLLGAAGAELTRRIDEHG